MRKRELWEGILRELLNIHYHLDRMEVFYMMVNGVKQDDKGVWIEGRKEGKIGLGNIHTNPIQRDKQ